jgi:putative ABC transport system permease protein
MKFFPLLWRNLLRRKTRTFFTILSVVVAFCLFGLLAAVRLAYTYGVDVTGDDRMIVSHKVSLIMPLPESYQARIEAIPGVTRVAHGTWFGGIYQDPKNFFSQMAVEPETFLAVYDDYLLPEEQKEAWLADRTGAVVGRKTAEVYGWSIGDRIPIQGTIWRKKDGGNNWEFTIRGVYVGAEKGVDETNFLFQYDYLDEARSMGEGIVGWYWLRIDDADRAAEIARTIDATFANSRFETKTMPEKAFIQSFAKQVGDIAAILRAVLAAVFFTLILVTGNTMAQAVRERTAEWAVLKAVGFTDGAVLRLVLSESLLLVTVGGFVGLGLGWLLVGSIEESLAAWLAVFYIPGRDILLGVAFIVLLGLACGFLPALQARRLSISDALRRS